MMNKLIPKRTARGAVIADCPPRQPRFAFKVASPFTVHGHRLLSLYRMVINHENPFIVLKIPKVCARNERIGLGIYRTVKAGGAAA